MAYPHAISTWNRNSQPQQAFDDADGCEYTLDWKYASDGHVPSDAVVAGLANGETCYVGRARHRDADEDAYYPGKIQPSHGSLTYFYNEKECLAKNYEVLVSVVSRSASRAQLSWIPFQDYNVPSNAIMCGRNKALQPVYIGRRRLNDDLIVDKVLKSPDGVGSTTTILTIPGDNPEVRYSNNNTTNISTGKCDEILVCQEGNIVWNPTAGMDFNDDATTNVAKNTTITVDGVRRSYTTRDAAYDAYVMNDRKAFWRARKRILALLVTLGIELFVGFVITMFTGTLRTYPLLISFMPVISAISGNVGLQCSSIVTRALACALTTVGTYKRAISRELKAAWYLATAIGCILAVISGLWQWCLNFGLVVGAAQFLSIMSAALTGSAAPLVGKFIRMDPAAFAGPMETALQDVVGNSCFLFLASIVLKHWPCPGEIIDDGTTQSLCPTADGTSVDANYCCTPMNATLTTTTARPSCF